MSAIQFAINLAPKRIGLFGIDIANADEPRFYERTGEAAKSGLLKARQRIIAHLVLAQRLCEQQGIVLSNHSSKSALLHVGFAYDASFERAPNLIENLSC